MSGPQLTPEQAQALLDQYDQQGPQGAQGQTGNSSANLQPPIAYYDNGRGVSVQVGGSPNWRPPAPQPQPAPPQLTPDQAQAILANSDPSMSTAEDVGRSVVSGGERGAAGLLGSVGDLQNIFGRLGAEALHHGYGFLQDVTGSNLGVPYMGAKNNSFSTADMNFADLPDSGAVNQAVQQVAGPYHVPQTGFGQWAERATEFAPIALAPGGMLARAARVALPTAGSEAGEYLAPKGYKDIGAMVGALGAGGLEGFGEAAANPGPRLIANAVRNTPASAITAGADLKATAAALPGGGLFLTSPEAVGSKSMLALQHFVENSPIGKPLVEDLFAQRPQQVQNVTRAFADAVAPPDVSPSASAVQNQRAAQAALYRADQMRTGLTRPSYAAAENVPVPDISDLHDALTTAIATDKTGQVAPVLQQFYDDLHPNGVPLTDVGPLDTVRQIWRDKIALPANSDKALPKVIGAKVGPLVDQLDTLLENASPDFARGKAIHADVSQNIIDPLHGGPVGAISKSELGPGQLPSQVNAYYPPQPPEGYANDVGRAISVLPPEVTGNLTRHYVVDNLNQTGRDLTNGEPAMNFGGTLASKLWGHPERAQAFDTALSHLDPSGALPQHGDDLRDSLFASGRRLPPGSGTEFYGQYRQMLQNAPAPIRFIGAALDPLEWGKAIDHAVGGALYKGQVKYLARVLKMDPAQARATLENAKANPSGNPLVGAVLLGRSPPGSTP